MIRDGDGILDNDDKCPDDPEDKDTFEDEDGCPDPDNDADGILDVNDECPMDPETMNGVDDEDGCPDQKLELVESGRTSARSRSSRRFTSPPARRSSGAGASSS